MSFFDDASLLQIPSGYKEDKLYSIKPTDGAGDFTFSRDGSGASVATRINSSGLIEKGHTNQILQSNQFDTTWSVSLGSSVTSGQSGYDGTTNAWRFTKDSEFDGVSQDTSGLGITNVNTISVYAKRVDVDEFILRLIVGGNTRIIRWDLTDGSLTSAHADYIAPIDGVAIGTTGFYRFSGTINGTLSEVQLRTDSTIAAGSVDIQAVQVEKGLVATDYIDTTTAAASAGLLGDMPRLDYSDGASCPCVLMEPARENLVTNSEYSGGYPNTDCTLSDNVAISPEGVKNAMKMTIDNTATDADFRPMNSVSLSVGYKYVFSFYAKADGFDLFQADFSNSGFSDASADFDLSGSGSVTSEGAATINADILPLTNGWFRCYITAEAIGTSSPLIIRNINTQVGDGTKGILFYGFQFEKHPTATAEEANATSYIPTYGTAVSRAYDVTNELTYDDDLTSVVLFGEITMAEVVRDTTASAITMRKASGSGSRFFVYRNNSSIKRRASIYRQNNTDSAALITLSTADRIKFAIQYNASTGSLKAFVNGANVLASPVNDPDFDEFVNFELSGQGGTMKVHQFAALKATYTNDELATLTTL